MMFGTAQFGGQGAPGCRRALGQPGDTRFQFADGFYIAELLIFPSTPDDAVVARLSFSFPPAVRRFPRSVAAADAEQRLQLAMEG